MQAFERGDSVPDAGSGLLGLGGGRMSKEKKSLTQRGRGRRVGAEKRNPSAQALLGQGKLEGDATRSVH